MRTLKLLFATFTFCLLFMGQSNAQTITNNSSCWFQVKANILPSGDCALSGSGILYGVSPGSTINVPLPGAVGSHWVPAYGVGRLGTPIKVPGATLCGFANTEFVGKCLGVNTFATFNSGHLTIN